MKNGKRITCFFMAAVTVLSLAGCSKSSDADTTKTKEVQYIAKTEKLEPEIESGYINAETVKDGKLYFVNTDNDIKNKHISIGIIDLETKEQSTVTLDSDLVVIDRYVNKILVNSDGGYTLLFQEYKGETVMAYIARVNKDGSIINQEYLSKLTGTDGGYDYIYAAGLDNDDNIVLCTEETIYGFDKDLKLINRIDGLGYIYSIVAGEDGMMYMSLHDSVREKYAIEPLDIKNSLVREPVSDISSYVTLFCGKDNAIYASSEMNLNKVNITTGERKQLFAWSDVYINSEDLVYITENGDGSFTAIVEMWDSNDEVFYEKTLIREATEEEIENKETVVLGCVNSNTDLINRVNEFNRSNEKYRVKLRSYVEEDGDFENGMERLNQDIISGDSCDIYEMTMMDYNKLAGKGAFADLYPYFEKDESINLSDYYDNLIKAFDKEGKLYVVTPSVYLASIAVNEKYLEEIDGWDINKLCELREKYKDIPFTTEATKINTLMYFVTFTSKDYFDKASGTCSFDSPEFIKVLEYCNTFPKDEREDADMFADLKNESVIMAYLSVGRVVDYQMMANLMGGKVRLCGFPSTHSSKATITPCISFAVSNKSKVKDGAWEFIKYMLSEEVQDEFTDGLPLLKASTEKLFKEAMKVETSMKEDGSVTEDPKMSIGTPGGVYDIFAATEDDIKELRDTLASANAPYDYDDKIINIVTEEAEAYFEGAKTAEEVASIIQNRAKTYLAENK